MRLCGQWRQLPCLPTSPSPAGGRGLSVCPAHTLPADSSWEGKHITTQLGFFQVLGCQGLRAQPYPGPTSNQALALSPDGETET